MSISADKREGIVIVLSGPSGAGKSTIYKKVLNEIAGLEFSVSCTTRSPRPGEIDGKDYHFVSREKFEDLLKRDAFAEHAEVHGNYYGTLKQELFSRIERGIDVLLDIDVQGANQIREACAGDDRLKRACEFVFIMPPSIEILEQRLRGRGTETDEVIQRRMKNAAEEMKHVMEYDYLLVNADVDETAVNFASMIRTFRCASRRIKKECFE